MNDREPTSTGHDHDCSSYNDQLEDANRRLADAKARGERATLAALNGPRIGLANPILALMLADARGLTKGEALIDYRRLEPVVPRDRRAGRNDPCPCGSGRKRKRCHRE